MKLYNNVPEDENVVTIGESVTYSVAASVAAMYTLSMNEPTVVTVTSGAAPPPLIAATTAPPTTSVILSTETLSSTTVSAAPPTLIADSLPTTSTTKSAVSEVSPLATSTPAATPTAESEATPITESAAPPTTTSAVIDYADQNKPVVKGPAGIIHESREEAGDFYTIFLDGRRILKLSYAIPPVAI